MLLNPLTALCIYIYAQSEKAFNSQCKHSIVLRHVFFKKVNNNPPEKITLGRFRRSPAPHPSERSSRGKLTIEGGHLPYQTQFTMSKSDWQMLWETLPKLGTPPEKIALSRLRRSPAPHPSKRSSHSKLTIEGGHLPYQSAVYRKQIILADAAGDSAEVRHPPAKTARLDSRLDQGLAMPQ